MNVHETFGAWTQGELGQSLQRELSGTPLIEAEAPPEDQFYANTVHALRKYTALTSDTLAPSIFFLSPEVPHALSEAKSIHRARRLTSGETSLSGCIWFVNPKVQRGQFYTINDIPLNDAIDSLMEFGLQNHPALIYNPLDPQETITYYPQGLDSDFTLSTGLAPQFVSVEKIREVIHNLYLGTLKTPHQATSTGAKIWSDTSKWYPAENVEKEIQGRMQSYMFGHFDCHLLPLSEIETGEGRLDLLLIEASPTPGIMIHHALLELKALRSFSNTGATEYNKSDHLKWVDKGTKQAIAYKEIHSPRHAILCCFDMCKEELTDEYWFSSSENLAKMAGILQWRWRLYNSADAYRNSKFS